MDKRDKEKLFDEKAREQKTGFALWIIGILFVLTFAAATVFMTVWVATNQKDKDSRPKLPTLCKTQPDSCIFQLVESIPENLTYPDSAPSHPSTYAGIKQLLALANETIEIASYYWTLRGVDLPVDDPSDWQGEDLFKTLVFAGKERGIQIRIVQSQPDEGTQVNDTVYLAENAGAEVRSLDFGRLLGSGIVHTKMWLIDRKHFYLGSANLDWRSFTQVKEMGATVQQCGCLAEDLGKIFDAYWYLAQPDSSIPSTWPTKYDTLYNRTNPMAVVFNQSTYNTFLSSSPPPICPSGRSQDGETIVDIINSAEEFVHIAVMDYLPTTQFSKPRRYWPVIDDAIRAAAFDRQVRVKLLISNWTHSWDEMFDYLQSLQDLHYKGFGVHLDIQVRLFEVPIYTDAQAKIPYARVNHNKYMVTEKSAYIGTSNWSGDYFITTAGIGLVIDGNEVSPFDIRTQLSDVFIRDWDSEYAKPLEIAART